MSQGQEVALAKVDEMFDAWREHQSYSHVARVCGVSRPTATKYAEEGDPSRGIEPFRTRLRRLVRKTHRRVEQKIVYTEAESKAAVRDQVFMLDQLIERACMTLMKDMKAGKLTLTSVAKAMLARNEIVRRMCPFDEVVVQDEHVVEDEFEGRTALEYEYYADNDGKWPTPEELKELQAAAGVGPDGTPIDVEAEHQRWGADDDDEELEETG